jgi:hypothetical protein
VDVVPVTIVATLVAVVGLIEGHARHPAVVHAQSYEKIKNFESQPFCSDEAGQAMRTLQDVVVGRGQLLPEDVSAQLDVV